MKASRIFMLALGMVVMASIAAFSAVPGMVNYQGYLKNADGTPVISAVTVRFSLYSSTRAGSGPVWRETKSVTPSNGIYSTQLGSTTPITAPFDVPYYLGVQAGADPEMSLQPLSSVPYAQRAKVADSVPDNNITFAKIADGAVTDAKITGPVSGSKIGSAGLNADTVDGLHASDFSRNTATDTSQANLLALIASLQAQINGMNQSSAASAPRLETDVKIDSPGYEDRSNPQVAMDAQGNAVAVWEQSDFGTKTVWVNRYTVGTGWGTAALLDTEGGKSPHVAMDPAGNAIAVWCGYDASRYEYYNIRSKRYSVESGWGPSTLIEADNAGIADFPQVTMNSTGNATVVWQQSDGIRTNIWANRYSIGVGWDAATIIESDNTGDAIDPKVAMDSMGNAIAIWSQRTDSWYIWSNRYSVSTGWGTPEIIDTDSPMDGDKPQIAMDAQGNAIAVWQIYYLDIDRQRNYYLRTNSYTAGAGWGTATQISTYSKSDHAPQVAMNDRGDILAVWSDSRFQAYHILCSRYAAGTGWGPAISLEAHDEQPVTTPHITINSLGNAAVAWLQFDGTQNNVWANRYNMSEAVWGTAFQVGSAAIESYNPRVVMDVQGNTIVAWNSQRRIYTNYLPTISWKAATLIETDNLGTALRPQVAMDPQGNAIAVWYQTDGARYNIWSNRYTVGGWWGAAALIETDNSGDASGPQVAMDTQGNAIAVWNQSDGARDNIWTNRYTLGAGWGTAALIETDNTGHARAPQVAMDSFGNAIAVWYQTDGVRNNIWANRYTLGTGWGTAVLIEADNAGAATAPQVVMDAIGNALAVWEQSDGTRYNIWANRYTAGVGWGTATQIETGSGQAYSPQAAMDSLGNAIAVWEQSDGIRSNIWANRYAAGIGWGTAVLIETNNTGGAGLPQVAMDAQGNATVVWSQSDGTRDNIWANRYVAGVGWGTAALLETNNAGSAGDAQVAMDPQGNALAVWGQNDGTRANIYGNWYNPGAGWGVPVLLETDNAGSVRFPQIAMIANGIATAVWQQSDGTRNNIWANRRQR